MCLVFIARISNVDILRSKVSEESWNKISDHSDHAKFDRHKPLFTNTTTKTNGLHVPAHHQQNVMKITNGAYKNIGQ